MSKRQRFFLTLACLVSAILLLLAVECPAQQPAQQATYRQHGPAVLNDLTVTPGAAGTMTTAQLCAADFHTGSVRNVPESLKQRVCRSYGIAKADCTGKKYEIDHLISLELGGTNDQANLWPQPYFPKPGAKEKDVVENYLHRQVCSGAMQLADAQKAISTDWYAVYLTVNAPAPMAWIFHRGDPSGACKPPALYQNADNGRVYLCVAHFPATEFSWVKPEAGSANPTHR
jgi:hypothetical protein